MSIDQRWSALAISQCVAHGIDHFFLAPGSRCTPLTLAVAHHLDAKVTQHLDERGLAFAALGYARATGKPGVLVCTSGTAVANAYPAVVEASMDAVPMLLFTADRPPELRGTGANQTIDQQHIFGDYPAWFFDVPCPDEQLGDEFVRDHVERAIRTSAAGPVHLNWMFREPFGLEPLPWSRLSAKRKEVDQASAPDPGKSISIDGNTLVIVGGCTPVESHAAVSLAARLDAPLLTDITSGLRAITPDVADSNRLPRPDTVIHVGGRIVSKRWLSYTKELSSARHLHLVSQDVTINPHHLSVEKSIGSLPQLLANVRPRQRASAEFRHVWEQAQEGRTTAIRRVLDSPNAVLSEPALAYHLAQWLPSQNGLFIGNSSPIRDMDWFADWPLEKQLVVEANRGASGIDGVIASAVGFARGLGQPTTLLIGDLSALHDLNSLALVARSELPITIIIVNNQAGGIFDMLPVATHDHFEQYFATPHGWAFEHACAMFDLEYRSANSLPAARAAYLEAVASGRPVVVEVATDRVTNGQVRQRIAAEISK